RSLSDRAAWIRTAPHLVRPLPVLVPCSSRVLSTAFRAAVRLTALLERDLKATIPQAQQLPPGRVLSSRDAIELVPEVTGRVSAGALLFYDAQLTRPERAIIEIVSAAVAAGAVAANYVEARQAWRENGTWKGVMARDVLTGSEIAIRARHVVIAAGPASPALTDRLLARTGAFSLHHTWSLNLALDRPPPRVAFALDGGPRRLFVVPWRGLTIIGTAHYEDRPPDQVAVTEEDVKRFLNDVNAVWPGRPFEPGEVRASQGGLIALSRSSRGRLRFQEAPIIVDHGRHGTPEVVTAVTEKLTTARYAAEKAVNLVCSKLGHQAPCVTARTLLPGAAPRSVEAPEGPVVPERTRAALHETYGTLWTRPLEYARTWNRIRGHLTPEESVLVGQLAKGAMEEMAQNPDDLLYRRVDLGPRGLADRNAHQLAQRVLEEAQRRLLARVGTA
ncbi:MAG: FAD-dependent oxidoreductase, partial [Gemmatimonadota bacterium]|nr:FAD-dependent oxidoreductase [Gemmatimonadota bacterium]